MNRDVIKLIAMLTMLLNHVAAVFLQPETPLYELLTDIGYFTAITMCYFLVEGYEYTRSRKRYGQRLLVFALLSQIPFSLALSEDGKINFTHLNMMFTLFFCFLIICASKQIEDPARRRNTIILLTLCTSVCDWPIFAAVFTVLFLWAGHSRENLKQAYIWSVGLFWLCMFLSEVGSLSLGRILLYSMGAALGVALSGCCILYLYNGKRIQRGQKVLQWFFYLFYPCHLMILALIRLDVFHV